MAGATGITQQVGARHLSPLILLSTGVTSPGDGSGLLGYSGRQAQETPGTVSSAPGQIELQGWWASLRTRESLSDRQVPGVERTLAFRQPQDQ